MITDVVQRLCAICGVAIGHRRRDAKTCSERCKLRLRPRARRKSARVLLTLEIDGVVNTLLAWSAKLDVPYNLLYQRRLAGAKDGALLRPWGTRTIRPIDRFNLSYTIDLKTRCWVWRFRAYGTINVDGHVEHAHRASWRFHRGPIPDGLWVLHNCPGGDNARCVNPDHLWLGTAADNSRDASAKGRLRGSSGPRSPEKILRGEACGRAKLTESDVRRMRDLRTAGATLTHLGNLFGVHHVTARKVVLGLAWTHVR